jgi:hypothetical protein
LDGIILNFKSCEFITEFNFRIVILILGNLQWKTIYFQIYDFYMYWHFKKYYILMLSFNRTFDELCCMWPDIWNEKFRQNMALDLA